LIEKNAKNQRTAYANANAAAVQKTKMQMPLSQVLVTEKTFLMLLSSKNQDMYRSYFLSREQKHTYNVKFERSFKINMNMTSITERREAECKSKKFKHHDSIQKISGH
jgi:hypothetical protein